MSKLTIKSKQVVALCAVRDQGELIRFPGDNNPHGGFLINSEHSLTVHLQIQQTIAKHTETKVDEVILVEAMTPTFSVNSKETTLVLALIPPPFLSANEQWQTLPEIIKNLPQDRSRIPYIKAMQILAGGYDSLLSAVEVSGDIRSYIASLFPDDKS